MTHLARIVGFSALTLIATSSSIAGAVPMVGTTRPSAQLVDAWERKLDISKLGAKPVLVLYEDKDSAAQNQAFKDELAVLAKGDKYKKRIALVAVADVEGYDYWPVRGFVEDSIRDQSIRFGTTIFCDWNGAARRTLGAKQGSSNVILYGKDGKVLFAHEGAMSADTRKIVIALLRAQVES
ncbi:MAG: YtfJ family protein [Polyangiaceae bacterium]